MEQQYDPGESLISHDTIIEPIANSPSKVEEIGKKKEKKKENKKKNYESESCYHCTSLNPRKQVFACVLCQFYICPNCINDHKHELIPGTLFNRIDNCAFFNRLKTNQEFLCDLSQLLSIEEKIQTVQHYLTFIASDAELIEIQSFANQEAERFVQTKDADDQKTEVKIDSIFEFNELFFYRQIAIFFNIKDHKNEEWCCWNFKNAQSIENIMKNLVKVRFYIDAKKKDGSNERLRYSAYYPLKNLPSKLYGTFINNVLSLNTTFTYKNEKGKKVELTKIRLTKNDRRYCTGCLKSSFLIPLYRFQQGNVFQAITDKTKLGEQGEYEQFKVVEILGRDIKVPFRLKIKIIQADFDTTFRKVKFYIRKYLRMVFSPFFFVNYYFTNSQAFILSLLWLLNLIAVGLHVYPLTTIVFIAIMYSGYLSASQLASKKIYTNSQKVNKWFCFLLLLTYAVLSFIFDQIIALTLVSLITFVLLFSENAFYIVVQTMEFRNVIKRLYSGDSNISKLLQKNWEDESNIDEIRKESLLDNKEIKLSKFFRRLDTDEFSRIISRISFEIALCTTAKITSTVGFVYVLIITILKYVVNILGISSYIGSGTSYLLQVIGEQFYGILMIFLLVLTFMVFYAKIYINLQMTKDFKRIGDEIDHVLELLKFIEATPDSIIEFKRNKSKNLDFNLTRVNLGIKFHEWYKMETINVLDALINQLNKDNPENHKTTEALTNWICDHAKRSRLRLEFVKKHFTNLTDIVRFKLFGVLEIDSSLLWNLLAAGATVLGTSLFAFFKSNFSIR